jgi:hypothetical protein
MRKERIDKFCGDCCWFFGECTDGDGCCAKHYWEEPKNGRDPMLTRCDKKACKDFISDEEKRHHLAVLIQHNRWRRSDEVPNHCRMVNPTELGKAIDFVCEYVKIYERL